MSDNICYFSVEQLPSTLFTKVGKNNSVMAAERFVKLGGLADYCLVRKALVR